MKYLFKFKLKITIAFESYKKIIRQKWLVKKSKFVWRKKTHPSTNIPLFSYQKSEQKLNKKSKISDFSYMEIGQAFSHNLKNCFFKKKN